MSPYLSDSSEAIDAVYYPDVSPPGAVHIGGPRNSCKYSATSGADTGQGLFILDFSTDPGFVEEQKNPTSESTGLFVKPLPLPEGAVVAWQGAYGAFFTYPTIAVDFGVDIAFGAQLPDQGDSIQKAVLADAIPLIGAALDKCMLNNCG